MPEVQRPAAGRVVEIPQVEGLIADTNPSRPEVGSRNRRAHGECRLFLQDPPFTSTSPQQRPPTRCVSRQLASSMPSQLESLSLAFEFPGRQAPEIAGKAGSSVLVIRRPE